MKTRTRRRIRRPKSKKGLPKRRVEIMEDAQAWARLMRREAALHEERTRLGKRLIPKMKRSNLTHVPVGKGQSVQLVIDHGKSHISKAILVKHFGAKRAETFWKKHPDKVLEYLSLLEINGRK